MTSDESTYEITFDDRGRIRVRDAELAHRLLRLAGSTDGIEIVIDARPVENGSEEWKHPLPPMIADSAPPTNETCQSPINGTRCPIPPPINTTQCQNALCPFEGILRISESAAEEWQQRADTDARDRKPR
jgi:hypothetical protein